MMNRRTFLATVTAVGGAALYGERVPPRTAKDPATLDKKVRAAAHSPKAAKAAAAAIRYASMQNGKPYVWGGTGPDVFDCSGLVMMAYRSAGIDLPRTSQQQWADGHRVGSPVPGDLVFFPGTDGTWSAPGHVGLVVRPGWMWQAYASGTPVGLYPFGTGKALPGTGPGDVVGYTRPAA